MWTLINETAYAAERTWVRDTDGRHHWLVVVKATFEFQLDGSLALADEQLEPLYVPEHFGSPESSSLRYDADLIGPKPTTDLIVNAHAHAPRGRPTQEVPVGLSIGALQKTLLVRGPSHYIFGVTGLRVSTPESFVTQAIRYEHAFGGLDPRNPVGTGVAQRDSDLHGQAAPSVHYLRGNPVKVGPAGFGAIACHWSPRRELAGTHDRRWFETRRPLRPDDYDPAHSLCSPIDQRLPRLHGGERVALVNLSPIEVLVLELPRCSFVATTRIGRQSVEHGFELASVIIEPEDHRLIMVWQASLPVRAPQVDDLIDSRVREVRS